MIPNEIVRAGQLRVFLITLMVLMLALPGCAPESQIDTACPKSSATQISFPKSPIPASLSILRSAIKDFLNSGQNAAGLKPLILDDHDNTIGSITTVDVTGDGVKEIVLSTTTSTDIDGYKFGWVGIYECANGRYDAKYAGLGEYIYSMKVNAVLDTLGSGTPQIFVEYRWRGRECHVGLQVLAHSSSGWEWIFGNYLNCPATATVNKNPITGQTQIVYKGTLHDSMGLEPDKEVTQIYIAKNGGFQLAP